jgi:uncharacterized repeat protein (TIGR03803 family)
MQSQRMQENGNFSTASGFCQLMAAVLVYAALAIPASAQTYAVLHNFGTEGTGPNSLVQGFNGKFYGTTLDAFNNPSECNGFGCGILFEVGRYGGFAIVHSFCALASCADGANPLGTLIVGSYGSLYGTTGAGGSNALGTLFRFTPGAASPMTVLYNFSCPYSACDGVDTPSLIEGWDGSLYGAAYAAANCNPSCPPVINGGTIYRLSPGGDFSTSFTFPCSAIGTVCPDGSNPRALVQGDDGNIYGLTYEGGVHGKGTVFKIGPAGFEKLHDFCAETNCTDGAYPLSLIQGADGNLYGTTQNGGSSSDLGTVFKITTSGTLEILHTLCVQGIPTCTDGAEPVTLLQGTDAKLYGLTSEGSSFGNGSIFRLNTDGGFFRTLHKFSDTFPFDAHDADVLIQGTDGAFYGETFAGGSMLQLAGTIFRLDVGLGPFVRPVLTFGHVGDHVSLLGSNMTGVSAVSFNGAPATIISSCETHIATTVPEGATSGPITVTTSTGTLTSNVAFTVLP